MLNYNSTIVLRLNNRHEQPTQESKYKILQLNNQDIEFITQQKNSSHELLKLIV